MRTHPLLFLGALVAALPLAGAQAVDGVIEINQLRANAGGVSPGDTPGIPVTISESGSYRLTGNLFGGTAIDVDPGVSDVTIDMNGFFINSGGAAGPGIRGRERTTVMNGSLRSGFNMCLEVGDMSRVIDVKTEDCGTGILAGNFSTVLRSSARNHTANGIEVGVGSLVRDSLSESNTGIGVLAGGISSVRGTTVRQNADTGISMGVESLAATNIAGGNGLGIVAGARSVVFGNDASSSTQVGIFTSDAVLAGNSVASNASSGIGGEFRSVVRRNNASDNGGDGINTRDGSAVIENVTSNNGANGILCSGVGVVCGVVENTAISNVGSGLLLPVGALTNGTYKKNTLSQNGTDVTPAGADPGFQNTCSGTVPCP